MDSRGYRMPHSLGGGRRFVAGWFALASCLAAVAAAGEPSRWAEVQSKMEAEGLSPAFVQSFKHSYHAYVAGDLGLLPEAQIEALGGDAVPSLEKLRATGALGTQPSTELLERTVVFKLNGGLGTSMGLERAKSVLTVRNGTSFLDLISRQVLRLREKHRHHVRFTLMNSFSTSADTLDVLRRRYPELAQDQYIEVVQNKAPKIERDALGPASHPPNPRLEWCPPGHGKYHAGRASRCVWTKTVHSV
jgi:hypothetical protein